MNATARVVVLTLMLQASAMALVNAYHVEPTKAMWSGKVLGQPPYGGVSQVLTCSWDQLDEASGAYCELFVGSHSGAGLFKLDVYECDNGPWVAYNEGISPAGEYGGEMGTQYSMGRS